MYKLQWSMYTYVHVCYPDTQVFWFMMILSHVEFNGFLFWQFKHCLNIV